MSNKNPELSPDTIRLAVPEISAQKVRSIMKKYRSVLSALPAAELQGAVDRKNLDKITKKLLVIGSTAGNQGEIDRRKQLINELDRELALLATDLDLFESGDFEEVQTTFDQMGKLFKKHSINANMQDYMNTYLSLPAESRVPVCDIQDSLIKILSLAHEVWDKNILEVPSLEGTIFEQPAKETPLLKRSELDNLFTILGMYCWGNREKAEKERDGLLDRLNFYKRCDHFRTDTGLNNLTNVDINGIFTALIKIGVNKDKVDAYAVKEIKKIKALNKEHYEILAKGMNSYELSAFLLAAIASQKETSTKKSKDALKVTFRVEAELVLMRERVRKANEKNVAKLKKTTDELNEYRNKSPHNVKIDSEIVKLENDIASYRYEIALNEYAGLFAQTQHEMANSYLSKKSVNPTSKKSKEFFEMLYSMNYKDDGSISDFTDFAKELSVPIPPSTSFLVSAHLQVHALEDEWAVKKWYVENPKYVDSLNEFYKTGKVSPENRNILLEGLDFESKHVEETIERFMAESVDVADFYKGLRTRHDNINELSPEKAKEASVRLTGYLMLLSNLRGLNSKLLGIYNSFDYLGEGLTDSKERIAGLKDRDSEYVSALGSVADFMGRTEEISIPDLELHAESPLYRPLLQREFGPIFQNVGKQFKENVIPAQEKIAGINPQLKYWSKHPNEQMRTHGFDVADKYFGEALTWLRGARNEIVVERKKLLAMLDDDGLFKDMPKAMKLLRIRLIRKAIDGLDKILDDKKSALSMLGINNLVTARAKLKKVAENFYLKGLAYGFAIAIVMAAAIGVAVAGGYAFAALGSGIFGGITATIGSVAVADLAIGLTTMVGVSAGGVLGSRGGMSFTQATGMADWGGYEKIWEPKRMARDFGIALALNLAAVGTAKFIVGSLKFGAGVGLSGKGVSARSARFASRFPGLSNASRGMLEKMGVISKIASPSGWFQGGGVAIRHGVLRQFGARVVQEGGEEAVETAAGAIHPVAGFFATVANASNGCNVQLALHGIRAADVGIVTEGKSFAYTTTTAEEFVANFKTEFSGQKGQTFKTTINDGVVTIDFVTTNAKGKTERTFIDVQPAQLSTNLSVDTEISRIPGLSLNEQTGDYSVKNSTDAIMALKDLRTRNYIIVKTDTGIRASKGDYSIDISISPQVQADGDAKLGLLMDKARKLAELQQQVEKGKSPKLKAKLSYIYADLIITASLLLTGCNEVNSLATIGEVYLVWRIFSPAVARLGGTEFIFQSLESLTNRTLGKKYGNLKERFESLDIENNQTLTDVLTSLEINQEEVINSFKATGKEASKVRTAYNRLEKISKGLFPRFRKLENKQKELNDLNNAATQENPVDPAEVARIKGEMQKLETEVAALYKTFDKQMDIVLEGGEDGINLKAILGGTAIIAILYWLIRRRLIKPVLKTWGVELWEFSEEGGEKKRKSGGNKPIDPFGGGVIEGPSETDAGAGKPSKKKGSKAVPVGGDQGPIITPGVSGKNKKTSSKSSLKEAIDIYKGGQKGATKKKKTKRASGTKKAGRFEDVEVDESK